MNMLRPMISQDLFDRVKILSKNISGSFEDSLKIVVEELERTRKQKEKNVSHE